MAEEVDISKEIREFNDGLKDIDIKLQSIKPAVKKFMKYINIAGSSLAILFLIAGNYLAAFIFWFLFFPSWKDVYKLLSYRREMPYKIML